MTPVLCRSGLVPKGLSCRVGASANQRARYESARDTAKAPGDRSHPESHSSRCSAADAPSRSASDTSDQPQHRCASDVVASRRIEVVDGVVAGVCVSVRVLGVEWVVERVLLRPPACSWVVPAGAEFDPSCGAVLESTSELVGILADAVAGTVVDPIDAPIKL